MLPGILLSPYSKRADRNDDQRETDTTTTKSELISRIAAKASITHVKAETVVLTIFDSMIEALVSGSRIELRGFGSFENRHYPAYLGRNPRSGDVIAVKAKVTPFFKASCHLKKDLNET